MNGRRVTRLTREEALRAAERIRELRRQRKWRQADLGKRAGLAQSCVANAEAGNGLTGRRAMACIAGALGLTSEELLGECPRCEGSPRPWTRCLACGAAGETT